MSTATRAPRADIKSVGYVTARVDGQLFGVPISHVQDVFIVESASVARVPLAPPEVAGVVNRRGRIMTVVDLRVRLGMPPRAHAGRRMAIGLMSRGETYALIVDSIGDVLTMNAAREENPMHLGAHFRSVADGVHQLASELLVVLDVERVLDFQEVARAA